MDPNAMERGQALPPVELYQLGSGYYVFDGHHRVAAARQLGQLELDANVVRFVPAVAAAHTDPPSAGSAALAGSNSHRAHGHDSSVTHAETRSQQQNRDHAGWPRMPRTMYSWRKVPHVSPPDLSTA
jgi:hypothetical protein